MISCAYGDAKLDNQLQQVISQESVKNHINSLSLSVGLPTQKIIKNYVAGTISRTSKTPIMANERGTDAEEPAEDAR